MSFSGAVYANMGCNKFTDPKNHQATVKIARPTDYYIHLIHAPALPVRRSNRRRKEGAISRTRGPQRLRH